MNRDNQIEEKDHDICKTCIHYYVCWKCDENTLACSHYRNENEYRKASDVAKETLDRLEGYFDLFDDEDEISVASLRETIAELKKKYESEGSNE